MFVTGTSERNSQGVLLRPTIRQERMEDTRGDPISTPWVPLHTAMVSAVAWTTLQRLSQRKAIHSASKQQVSFAYISKDGLDLLFFFFSFGTGGE